VVGPLTELIVLTYGPHVVVADEFGDLQDVASVVIFGSWAALYRGRRGLSCGWTARSTRPSAPAPSGLIRLSLSLRRSSPGRTSRLLAMGLA